MRQKILTPMVAFFYFGALLLACSPEKPVNMEKILAEDKTYVGSDTCKQCHLEHYDSWKETMHSLMTQDAHGLQFIFVIGRRPEDLTSLTLSLFKGVKLRHVSLLSPEDTSDLVRLSERNGSLKWPWP